MREATLALATVAISACGEPYGELPTEGALLPINGTELYVKRIGAGEPVVIVHGGPMLEHGYLLPHLRPLADNHELIFYDQRLSGRSAARVDSASVRIATFVDDIEEIRRSLGLQRMHLLGHSWGGVERQAIRATEAFANQEPDAIAQLLRLSFRLQFADTSMVNELQFHVPEDYSDRSRQFGYMMVDLMGYDLHDALTAVTVPTLILYGLAEPATELSGAKLHATMPNSELVVIDDAGHFPFIEQPVGFTDAVKRFLNQNRGRQGTSR
jgi:proline iminopeptidase